MYTCTLAASSSLAAPSTTGPDWSRQVDPGLTTLGFSASSQCDEQLSNLAFKFNLRHYIEAGSGSGASLDVEDDDALDGAAPGCFGKAVQVDPMTPMSKGLKLSA